mmetsp:Transcript_4031/g.15175  ORF Transcript_4031/g.15175 Transcript_4031/m.15175 type:complete len:654 (-) Transcript_4031:955-2916(-)
MHSNLRLNTAPTEKVSAQSTYCLGEPAQNNFGFGEQQQSQQLLNDSTAMSKHPLPTPGSCTTRNVDNNLHDSPELPSFSELLQKIHANSEAVTNHDVEVSAQKKSHLPAGQSNSFNESKTKSRQLSSNPHQYQRRASLSLSPESLVQSQNELSLPHSERYSQRLHKMAPVSQIVQPHHGEGDTLHTVPSIGALVSSSSRKRKRVSPLVYQNQHKPVTNTHAPHPEQNATHNYLRVNDNHPNGNNVHQLGLESASSTQATRVQSAFTSALFHSQEDTTQHFSTNSHFHQQQQAEISHGYSLPTIHAHGTIAPREGPLPSMQASAFQRATPEAFAWPITQNPYSRENKANWRNNSVVSLSSATNWGRVNGHYVRSAGGGIPFSSPSPHGPPTVRRGSPHQSSPQSHPSASQYSFSSHRFMSSHHDPQVSQQMSNYPASPVFSLKETQYHHTPVSNSNYGHFHRRGTDAAVQGGPTGPFPYRSIHEPIYFETLHHPQYLHGSIPSIAQQLVSSPPKKSGRRQGATSTGITCHQCKQKSINIKVTCKHCPRNLKTSYCRACLKNRYGEDMDTVKEDPSWRCPLCRSICNCASCRRKANRTPHSISTKTAKKSGFPHVHALLVANKEYPPQTEIETESEKDDTVDESNKEQESYSPTP